MLTTSRRISLLPAALLLAALGHAQQSSDAGLGTVKRFFNASDQPTTFDATVSGIAYVGGKVYCGSNAVPPVIYEYEDGKLKRTFPTPMAPSGGTFDLDTDGRLIFATSAAGIIVFDPTNGNTNNLQIRATTGLRPLRSNPVPVGIPFLHAVAFNPDGNNGKGSFFVGSQVASAPIVELALGGRVLRTYANNNAWSAAGLTYDPRTRNLWCMNEPNGFDILELKLDTTAGTLTPTGVKFRQGTPSVQWGGRCCGGICGIPGGDQFSYSSDFDMAVLTRLFGDDYAFIQRVHLYPGRHGNHAARLAGSINSPNLGLGPRGDGSLGRIQALDVVRWRVETGTSASGGLPAFTLVDAGPGASIDYSTLPLFPELRIDPLSPTTILVPGTVGQAALAATIPPNALRCFWLVRFQAVYMDPRARPPFQLAATNEIWAHWSDEASCQVLVEAVGTDSQNAVTTSGFFRVIHRGGPPIEAVTFDFMADPDPTHAPRSFDVDEVGMGDFFNAGNSTAAGFRGTYRNGSDVATGLVYDAANWPVHGSASPGANSGFMARNGSNNGNGNNVKTLTFRFAGGKFAGTTTQPMVFEFDCDTDGGPNGEDGASMAGMILTVVFRGGQVVKGELRADPTASVSRSVCGW